MDRCRCWSRERHPLCCVTRLGEDLGCGETAGRRRTLILLVRQLWQFWDALPQYTIVRRGVAPEQRPADRQSGFRRGLAAGQLAARRRSSKADWYYAMLCYAGCVPSPQQQQHQQQVDGRRCRDAVKQPGTARWWSKMGTRSRKEGGMAGNDGDGSAPSAHSGPGNGTGARSCRLGHDRRSVLCTSRSRRMSHPPSHPPARRNSRRDRCPLDLGREKGGGCG